MIPQGETNDTPLKYLYRHLSTTKKVSSDDDWRLIAFLYSYIHPTHGTRIQILLLFIFKKKRLGTQSIFHTRSHHLQIIIGVI